MAGKDSDTQMQKWSVVLLNAEPDDIKDDFRENLAGLFYSDIQRTQQLFESPVKLSIKEFDRLPEGEKKVWYKFVDGIPGKLISVNLKIRRFNDFCRTCLIPYSDLEHLAMFDYDLFCMEDSRSGQVAFQDLPEQKSRFFIELNHLIPVELKKKGFEIIRPEEIAEINEKLVSKLARAIHSRYLHQVRKQNSGI